MRTYYKLSVGQIIFKIFNYAFLTVFGALTFYPFYFILIGSITEPRTIYSTYFWPTGFFYANYYQVFRVPELWQSYLISILRVATAVPSMLIVTSAAAFALSRKEMLLRTPIIFFFFLTMFFNGGLIPYYMTIKTVGLINRFLVYVIPVLFSVWTMIVMKTSIQSLPVGLVDAAIMDGASYARIHFKIILPLSKAMLAVLGLFMAVGTWNDWFVGAFFIRDSRLKPLQTFLQAFAVTRSRYYVKSAANPDDLDIDSALYRQLQLMRGLPAQRSRQYAYIMIGLVPIVLLYPFLQKYFVKGVLIGSIKE